MTMFFSSMDIRIVLVKKLIIEYRAEALTSAIAPYLAFKLVVHEMVCLSESHRRLNLMS